MIRFRLFLTIAPLLLSGCVAGRNIDAPSLAQRDYEKMEVPLPDEASEPASTLDPALAAKLKTLLDSANAAHAGFMAAQDKTAGAINRAANTPAGSEAWTVAQQELSVLDTSRGPLQAIEADVDALHADPANATPANRNAIDALTRQVQALGDQETAAVMALGAKLKS